MLVTLTSKISWDELRAKFLAVTRAYRNAWKDTEPVFNRGVKDWVNILTLEYDPHETGDDKSDEKEVICLNGILQYHRNARSFVTQLKEVKTSTGQESTILSEPFFEWKP
jgi:hypothetical protein